MTPTPSSRRRSRPRPSLDGFTSHAVTASALLTLEELAPGRVSMGIGTGDSALWGVGMRPATVARLGEYIMAVKALLPGEEATYGDRTFRMQWSDLPVPADIPVVVAVSGPRVLQMACDTSDGMLLSMGFGPHNVSYVRELVERGCAGAGRDPAEMQLWRNSEVVFGDSPEEARDRAMAVATEWLTMGSLEGKQIPDHLRMPWCSSTPTPTTSPRSTRTKDASGRSSTGPASSVSSTG